MALGEAELALINHLVAGRRLAPADLQRAVALVGEGRTLAEALLESGALDVAELTAEFLAAGLDARIALPPAGPRLIGRYQLLREIARGGMGAVYEAHDPQLGRSVALKLLADPHGRPETLQRFQREAVLAAGLAHPGIVQIHQVGHDPAAEAHFIAMELVDGPTLAEALPGLDRARRIALLEQVAQAIGHAHAQGVIHRDLKPANVLLAPDGRAVVTDFGLGRQAASGSALTGSGVQLGTIHYMAPEQVEGRCSACGPPADVWALGVMLYEALYDRRPFTGGAAQSVYESILAADPLWPRDSGAPVELQTICRKALAREPRRRYADGAAFAEELRRHQAGEPILARPDSSLQALRRRIERRPWAAVATLLALALLLPLLFIAPTAERAVPAARSPAPAPRPARAGDRARQLERVIHQTRASFYVAGADVRTALGRLARRLEEFERRPAPHDLLHHTLLGVGLALVGELARAEGALQAALRLDPHDGWVHYHLGRLYLRRAMAALVGHGARMTAAQKQLSAALAARALQHLRRPAGGWSGAGPLDRLVARACRALAAEDAAALRRICRQGIRRFGEEPGVEELWILLGWLDSGAGRAACYARARRIRPHHAWLDLLLGSALLGDGRLDEAEQALSRALALEPRLAAARLNLGWLFELRGQSARARTEYDRAIEADPRFAVAYHNRAGLRRRAGDLTGARSDYDAAIERAPRIAILHAARADLRRETGDAAGAVADCERALALDPRCAEAWNNRGAARHAQGQVQQALADFERAIALAPRHAGAHVNRGNVRLARGDRAGALADFDRAIALDPRCAEAYYNRGGARLAAGDSAGALADYDQAIAFNPRHVEAHLNRGVLHHRARRLDRAIADLSRAIALDPHNARAHNNRGLVHAAAGRAELARADLDRAVALDPRYPEAVYNRGNLRKRTGDPAGALRDLSRAIALDPRFERAYFNRGILHLRAGRLDPAIADFTRSLELQPKATKSYNNRGIAYLQQGRKDLARADFERVVDLDPRAWQTWFNLGLLRQSTGDLPGARAALRRALATCPERVRSQVTERMRQMGLSD